MANFLLGAVKGGISLLCLHVALFPCFDCKCENTSGASYTCFIPSISCCCLLPCLFPGRLSYQPSPTTFASHIHNLKLSKRRKPVKLEQDKETSSTDPSHHSSFSQLVSDKQFAAIGLVLLGVLGRVARIIQKEIGFPRKSYERAEDGLSQSRGQLGKEKDLIRTGESKVVRSGGDGSRNVDNLVARSGPEGIVEEDFGEVIARSSSPSFSKDSLSFEPGGEREGGATSLPSIREKQIYAEPEPQSSAHRDHRHRGSHDDQGVEKRNRGKRKRGGPKGNAIDDLFDGLV